MYNDYDDKILSEKYNNIYTGKLVEDDDEKDTSLGAENEEDEELDNDSEEETDSGEEETDSGEEETDSDEEETDSDEEETDSDDEDTRIKNKIKQLQKQYNDILIDAFEKYGAECIENALNNVKSSFGENITTILDDAMGELKSKILDDLGVETSVVDQDDITPCDMAITAPITMGSDDLDDLDDEEDEEDEEDDMEESCNKKPKTVTESTSKTIAKFYGFID